MNDKIEEKQLHRISGFSSFSMFAHPFLHTPACVFVSESNIRHFQTPNDTNECFAFKNDKDHHQYYGSCKIWWYLKAQRYA